MYLDIVVTRFVLDSSVQFGGFCEFGSRSGRYGPMATRAQHRLLIENYRYTVPGHSAEHAGKLDSWN